MSRNKARYAASARSLAAAIKQARRHARMSQQSLAEGAAISIGTVRNIEQGIVSDPGLFEVVAIARELSVTVDSLVSVDDEARGTPEAR